MKNQTFKLIANFVAVVSVAVFCVGFVMFARNEFIGKRINGVGTDSDGNLLSGAEKILASGTGQGDGSIDGSVNPVNVFNASDSPLSAETDESNESDGLEDTLKNNTKEDKEKITASTKMVYEYYYNGDGIIERNVEAPPYFLLDMTKENIEKTFAEWSVLSFSENEVVLRKYIDSNSNQYYIVGIHEGYIAVFYAAEINGNTLKEVTNTPASVFSLEEQLRLKEGIHIIGEDKLAKVMEDYGS